MARMKEVFETRPPDAAVPPGSEESVSRPLLRSASLVGALTLVSRITGLLRESIHAWFLGTGMAADAFRIAFLLPNLLRRLVGEGAISSAFVPVYTEHLHRRGPEEGRIFAEKFLTFWLLVVTVIALLGIALAGWIVSGIFGRGAFNDPEKLSLTAGLSRLLFWYLVLIGAVAAAQGILNARGVFGLPAFAPIAFNLVFAAAAWLLVPRLGAGKEAFALAVAVLAGGVVQLLVLVPPLIALGIRLRPRYPFDHPGVREVMRLLLPGTIGAGIYQINVTLSTAMAARLDEGSVASLSYSNRLMEFVLGIFVFALSTVSLTALARHSAAGDRPAFERTLSDVLRLTVFITLPSTVGLYILRRPILALLFENGQFAQHSLDLTQAAFRWHIAGMVFVGWNRVLVACFHAQKDLKTPVAQGAANMCVHLALAYVLSEALGHSGIALAASAAAFCQTLSLFWVLSRRMRGLRFPGLARTTLKTLVASTVMGAACVLGMRFVWTPDVHSKLAEAAGIAVIIAAGMGVFFASARVLRAEEVRMLLGAMRSRRK